MNDDIASVNGMVFLSPDDAAEINSMCANIKDYERDIRTNLLKLAVGVGASPDLIAQVIQCSHEGESSAFNV
jgi:hypothetical protein